MSLNGIDIDMPSTEGWKFFFKWTKLSVACCLISTLIVQYCNTQLSDYAWWRTAHSCECTCYRCTEKPCGAHCIHRLGTWIIFFFLQLSWISGAWTDRALIELESRGWTVLDDKLQKVQVTKHKSDLTRFQPDIHQQVCRFSRAQSIKLHCSRACPRKHNCRDRAPLSSPDVN